MTLMTVWVTTVTAAALLAAATGGGGAGTRAAPAPGAGSTDGVSGARAGVDAAAAGVGCAGAPGAGARCWPVTGPGVRGRPAVLRGFDPPAEPWAAGHRGVDLPASPGTPVRAAAPGEVAFAGRVGGVPVVVVSLAGGLRTTYEPVRATAPVGARVAAGARVGVVEGAVAHCPGPEGCLHWGLLRGDVYLDPLTLLPPSLRRSGPSRLLPVYGAAGR